MARGLGLILLWTASALLLPATVSATNVELRVVDATGKPLSGRKAALSPSKPFYHLRRDPKQDWWRWKPIGSDGVVRFENVPPDTYKVRLDLRGTNWVPPDANPLRPPPIFTLGSNEGDLRIDVEVFEGVPVHLYLDLPVNVRGFQALLRHPASGATLGAPLYGDGRETTLLLPRGVWEVEVQPIQGFLLVSVLINRQDWTGTTPVLDLVTDDVPPDLVFTYSAPVEVEGTVTERYGRRPAVAIRASLLDPGPWHAAAVARRVKIPETVEVFPDPQDRYHMYLPEGLWRVEPVGDNLLESSPANVERRLGSGEALRADFTIELEDGEARPFLPVEMDSEAPQPIREAFAAVFDEASTPEAVGRRFWSARVEGSSFRVYDLPPGRYQVVAGTADTLEAHRLVEYEGDETGGKTAFLRLPQGIALEMLASDLEGRRQDGMELVVERLDELPPLFLDDPHFLAAKKGRRLLSDLAGRGQATGFYPGRYRLTARLAGERGATGFAEVRVPGDIWRQELELDLGAEESVRIEVRERPAARLAARLDCADAWQLPETVAVRLLDGWALTEEEPIMTLDAHTLTGPKQDRLVVGPLEAATYVVGIRPEGFERWTWVYGADTPERAEAIPIETGDRDARRAIDLGQVLVECGPAVDLLPKVAAGGRFPPWGEVLMFARSVSLATEKGLRDLDIEGRQRRLEVREMPRGEQTLEIFLEHPWFLPEPELLWELPVELERGMYRQIRLEIADLGGAVDLWGIPVAGRDAHVRAIRDQRSSRVVPVRDGRALIPSLIPGSWQIELCSDADCLTPEPLTEVEIQKRQTSKVDLSTAP